MTRIILNDHPTWARLPKKKGKTIVLLHGGLSSSTSLLRTLGPGLSKRFQLAAFDRRGHGRTADTDQPFSYETMADEAIAFLEMLNRPVYLLGHSDGANVALAVAMRRVDLVKRLVVVGGNFHHEGLNEMAHFTPDSPGFAEFATQYATRSPDGIEHAKDVVLKSLELVTTQPTWTQVDLARITVPVLVMSGDDDVAKLSHTVALYEALGNAQLAVVPGTSHSVLKERTKESVHLITHFLLGLEIPRTKYPLRRSANNIEL